MNDGRRKEIETIAADIAAIKERAEALNSEIEALQERIESVRDEEQEYHDNMPESFQTGEKGEKAQAAIDALDEAINTCEEMVSTIDGDKFDEVVSSLETAKE